MKMVSSSEQIHNYILAKDGNRPHLLQHVFAENAVLEMVVKTDAIAFPSLSKGIESIMDVLVRKFGQTYENVYTLCLEDSPVKSSDSFSCKWLVVMSEKTSGIVRVGCGRYDWLFQPEEAHLVEKLIITIENMQLHPKENLNVFMDWISNLPYPWCPAKLITNNTKSGRNSVYY